MKNIKILILFVLTFNFTNAFAGNLICEFDGTETKVEYTYGDNDPVIVEVAPNVFAYTGNCDSMSCDLYFMSLTAGVKEYGFSKAETIRHEVDGEDVRCQDTGIGAVQEDVRDSLDSVEDAIDKAIDDTEDTVREIGRTIKNIFD